MYDINKTKIKRENLILPISQIKIFHSSNKISFSYYPVTSSKTLTPMDFNTTDTMLSITNQIYLIIIIFQVPKSWKCYLDMSAERASLYNSIRNKVCGNAGLFFSSLFLLVFKKIIWYFWILVCILVFVFSNSFYFFSQ